MSKVKMCPFLSQSMVIEGKAVGCKGEICALWHPSQQCSFLATAVNTDDTATILEEVKDILEELQLAVEDTIIEEEEYKEEVIYECPACGGIGNAEEWDNSTAKLFLGSMSPKVSIRETNEWHNCFFGCPKCGDKIDGEKITIGVAGKKCPCGCED